jgi:hypothetical protein
MDLTFSKVILFIFGNIGVLQVFRELFAIAIHHLVKLPEKVRGKHASNETELSPMEKEERTN